MSEKKKANITRIRVIKRSDDYHACLDGHPGIWGCGKSYGDAVGSVVSSHPERFNIEIVEATQCQP